MPKQLRTAVLLTVAAGVIWTASCGTIIHPDRVGQPHRGRLDASIVLLDGLGLLCFFIPGVIAFIVDFGTGAIYLPPEHASVDGSGPWRVVHVSKEDLNAAGIERAVAREIGRPVDLEKRGVRVERLQTIDEAPKAPGFSWFKRKSAPADAGGLGSRETETSLPR